MGTYDWPRLGEFDEDGRMLVDEYELPQLLGMNLPFFTGGALLTEKEIAAEMDLSTRQIRNLRKKGFPSVVRDGDRKFPQLDCWHWYQGFKNTEPRGYFTIWEARAAIMRHGAECDPDEFIRIPLSVANRLRPDDCEELDERWGDQVTVRATWLDWITERTAPRRKVAKRKKAAKKSTKRKKSTRKRVASAR
jgi:hypothetical protein